MLYLGGLNFKFKYRNHAVNKLILIPEAMSLKLTSTTEKQ